MNPEITRNQNNDNHNANDSKDVHLSCSHSMMLARDVCAPDDYTAAEPLGLIASSLERLGHGYENRSHRHRLNPQ
jgi:hypothetical protein